MHWRALCDNPYYRSGGIVAKLAVSCATSIWAALSIYGGDSGFVIPACFLILSAAHMLWFVAHWRPPFVLAMIGYLAMFVLWGRVVGYLIIFQRPPSIEESAACISTAVILGGVALVTGPKHGVG